MTRTERLERLNEAREQITALANRWRRSRKLTPEEIDQWCTAMVETIDNLRRIVTLLQAERRKGGRRAR